MLSSKLLLVLAGFLVASLSACDIPDRTAGTSSRVASRHCEHSIGSLVCSDGTDDNPTGTVKDPSLLQASFGAKGN